MSTISAGLVKVENLSVTGASAGAVDATNFKFTNLDVSGGLTAASISTNGNIHAGTLDLSGGLIAASILTNGNINTRTLDVSGNLTASGTATLGSIYIDGYPDLVATTSNTLNQIDYMLKTDVPNRKINFFGIKDYSGNTQSSCVTFGVTNATLNGYAANIGPVVNIGNSLALKGAVGGSNLTSIELGNGYSLTNYYGSLRFYDMDSNVLQKLVHVGTPVPYPNNMLTTTPHVEVLTDSSSNWTRLSGGQKYEFVNYDDNNKGIRIYSDTLAGRLIQPSVRGWYEQGELINNFVNTWLGSTKTYGDCIVQYEARIFYPNKDDPGYTRYLNGGVIPHAWTVARPRTGLDLSGNSRVVYIDNTHGLQVELNLPNGLIDNAFMEGTPFGRATMCTDQYISNDELIDIIAYQNVKDTSGGWTKFMVEKNGWKHKVWIYDHREGPNQGWRQTESYLENVQNDNNVARKTGKIAIQGHTSTAFQPWADTSGGWTEYRNVYVKPLDSFIYFDSSSQNMANYSVSATPSSDYSKRLIDYNVTGILKWISDGSGWDPRTRLGVGNTGNIGGDLSGGNALLGLNMSEFADCSGKIVLISNGLNSINDKVQRAYQANAVGCIIYNTQTVSSLAAETSFATNYNRGVKLPVIVTTYANASSIISRLALGEVINVNLDLAFYCVSKFDTLTPLS